MVVTAFQIKANGKNVSKINAYTAKWCSLPYSNTKENIYIWINHWKKNENRAKIKL